MLQAGRSGQPNDCSFLKLGNPGERMIVRSTSLEARLVAPGQTGRFLRLFAPRCCPAAWKLLHGLPGVPSFGTIVRYLAQTHQFCQGISSSLHARLPQLKNYCSVSDRARCRCRCRISESEQLGAARLAAPVLFFCEHWQKSNKFKLNYLLK